MLKDLKRRESSNQRETEREIFYKRLPGADYPEGVNDATLWVEKNNESIHNANMFKINISPRVFIGEEVY